jgi:hypothetical protein
VIEQVAHASTPMQRINGKRMSRKGFCVGSAGEVLANLLQTETRKESRRAPGQGRETPDVKKPNRSGLGFESGGPKEDRTPDLRIANAALSQLSYRPN